MCEMDTDSAYITISGDRVESLVKPELRGEFEQDKCNWFPHTREHKAYDLLRLRGDEEYANMTT